MPFWSLSFNSKIEKKQPDSMSKPKTDRKSSLSDSGSRHVRSKTLVHSSSKSVLKAGDTWEEQKINMEEELKSLREIVFSSSSMDEPDLEAKYQKKLEKYNEICRKVAAQRGAGNDFLSSDQVAAFWVSGQRQLFDASRKPKKGKKKMGKQYLRLSNKEEEEARDLERGDD